jgi:hypothetical protein
MYYQTLFNSALSGINGSNLIPGILTVASAILLASLLYSVYSAYAAGGDVRMLATSGVKYLIVGLVLANYALAFRDVNNMFNGVANYIVTSGPGLVDVFQSWGQQIAGYWSSASGLAGKLSVIWQLGQNLGAGVLGTLLLALSFVVYRISYLLFCLFYTFYGAALYVTGPFVMALMPSGGVGQLARTYLVNLMVFNAWGLIYALLSELIYAIHLNDVTTVVNNGTFLNLSISNPMIILGIASLLYALSIALIPYIASRIVRGDVGSTLLTIGGLALAAASTAVAAAGTALAGSGGGWAAFASAGGGGGNGAGGGARIGQGFSSAGVDSSRSSSSRPPDALAGNGPSGGSGQVPRPWNSGSSVPGRRQNFSFLHAASWYGGYAAHRAYDRMKGRDSNE